MQRALRLYFTMNVILLVMLAFSAPFLEPGSGAYVITVLSLAVIVPSIVLSGLAIRYGLPAPWGENA